MHLLPISSAKVRRSKKLDENQLLSIYQIALDVHALLNNIQPFYVYKYDNNDLPKGKVESTTANPEAIEGHTPPASSSSSQPSNSDSGPSSPEEHSPTIDDETQKQQLNTFRESCENGETHEWLLMILVQLPSDDTARNFFQM